MGPLRAALVTPISGPLARFGTAGAAALRLWATRASGVPAPWTGVELEVIDAYPSAAAAMRTAVTHRPDVVFGPYGSGPAVAALKATQRAVWNHGGATALLRRPALAHAINVVAPAAGYFDGVLRAIQTADQEIARVALLHSITGFGQEVASGAAAISRELGLELQATPYAPGQVAAAADALRPADALLVVGGFDDELAAARHLLGRGWRAAAFVGAGVEEVLAPLWAAREGLLGPAQWLARVAGAPEEGPDAAWFETAFHQEVGTEPPYPAAAAFAAGVLAARCLREAGRADDGALLATAARLAVRTLFGEFRLDPQTGVQVGHELLVVQWQAGVRRVVWPPARAERPMLPLRASPGC
jgi:branched-chain amino acid transport system substrate-binding protein